MSANPIPFACAFMPSGYWWEFLGVCSVIGNTNQESIMKKTTVAGWGLSLLAVVPIALSGAEKIMQPPTAIERMTHIGFMASSTFALGIVELLAVILFLIPRTALIGAILGACWMAGAIAAHVRIGEPFFVQLSIGLLIWVGFGLRRLDVIQLAFSAEKK